MAASGGNNPIAALEGRPTLSTLSLVSSGVTDIGPVAALTGLYTLSLKDNAITDVSPLSGLGRLVKLTLVVAWSPDRATRATGGLQAKN